jgi:hypothetical protein
MNQENPDTLWKATVTCATCKEVINTAEHVPTSEKARAAMGAPFMSFCKTKAHNTFSDLNWHFDIEWELEGEKE